MAAQTFGKTWWGSEWLKSLTHIDYANRIPRGSAYARNGAVKSINVAGNVITAKVSGRQPTPYKVTISVPLFKKEQTERLIKELLEQPALISKLLNRELDPEVFQVAKRIGLNLFPQRWNDLDMHCSCPDWAVPCKHLAAVIYMMSREIDNDPFLVFTMHGVDLLDELKKRDEKIEKEQIMDVPEISSLLIPAKKPREPQTDTADCRRVDFTGLHDITEPLSNLLPKNPSFSQNKDFQQVYASQMGLISRKTRRILQGKLLPGFSAQGREFDIRRDMHIAYQVNKFGLVFPTDGKPGKPDIMDCLWGDEFLDALTVLPADYLPDYDPSVQALHQALFCALHLLANGAVVPQIVKVADKYDIRWLPAMIAAEVAQVVAELDRTLPPGLLTLIAKKGRGHTTTELENQTECLLSYLIGCLIHALSNYAEESPAFIVFFKQYSYPFDGIGEKAMPGAIRSWLDRLFLSQRQFHPSLLISENGAGGFDLDVAIDQDGEAVMLKDVLADQKMAAKRFAILKELSLLASLISGLETYINRNGATPITFSTGEFVPFLFDTIPAIRLLGVRVLLPKSLQQLIRPRVSMKLTKKQTDGKSYLRLDEMLQFDWQVALGDTLVSPAEFQKLTQRAQGLIRFKQRYIYVDETDIARLTKAFEGNRPMSPAEMLQAALTESYDRAPIILDDNVRQLMRQLTEQADIPVPAGVNATLRPYQERGYSWMYRNSRIGFGSIIADDMGLGKTLQVITLMQKMKDEGALTPGLPVLTVVPTGLVTNWQAELQRFAPGLTVFTYHGPQRNLKEFKCADILLTTYGVLRSDAAKLKKHAWLAVVIDEAQNIKNADTAQSKAVRSIPAKLHIAMSGTPVENRLSEFWSIMDFANQGYLGSAKSFKEEFANPIQRQGDSLAANRFRRITAPFLLRRLKSDKSIINDLPDKIEQNELALLTEPQAALYQETLDHAMKAIEGIEATDHKSLFERQGLVLQMILALKQICNHPALFLKNGDFNPELSGKTEMLLSLLESIIESGQKVLVFTQFREMGQMLQQMIEQRLGVKPLFLHGGCGIKERQAMVDRFQQNPRSDHVFLLSLKAAGTGLNLTAASHVVHYDLWWNPAVEAQATDRAYRIGQHQNVVVHRFITQNTFEERIDKMIQDKRHLADMTVATGESWIGRLSNAELREIFR
ncbi:MAG: SWIM zinc finger family protein [Prevotella sp.]|nr:SWIM zinc finger family protein [Prevotella sp.]